MVTDRWQKDRLVVSVKAYLMMTGIERKVEADGYRPNMNWLMNRDDRAEAGTS